MLSRVADALYWMSRYVERAEHAARVLEVTRGILLELAEIDPAAADVQWKGTLEALGWPDTTADRLVFDESEVASIVSNVSRARENARQVREVISSEMWEEINQAYWALRDASGAADRDAALSQTLSTVVRRSFSWGGVTDGTMSRGDGWLFIKLGQFIERGFRTCRIVGTKSRRLGARTGGDAAAQSGDNVALLTLLRSCSALEAFRKVHPTRVSPRLVVEFLVFDRDFPRTVRYSVQVAADFAKRLGRGEDGRVRAVEREFGRLASRLEYSDVEDVLQMGIEKYLEEVTQDLNRASLALQHNYFLH